MSISGIYSAEGNDRIEQALRFDWLPLVVLDLSSGAQLFFGIILTIMGALFMAIGSALMKFALTAKSDAYDKPILAHHSWKIGFFGYTAGAMLHFGALAFAPASVLAPMNSIGLVANVFVATTILKERFSGYDFFSTLGMILGITLCAIATINPNSDDPVTPTQALIAGLNSWTDRGYLGYIGCCSIIGVMLLMGINSMEHRMSQVKYMIGSTPMLAAGEIIYQVPTDGEIAMLGRKIGLAHATIAGLIGSQCILELKELVAIIYFCQNFSGLLFSAQFWCCSAFFLFSVALQIYFLNFGLARGDATLVVPTYYVMWTLSSTFGGFAKFHEVTRFDLIPSVLFCTGFALNMVGVATMAVHEISSLRSYVEANVPEREICDMDLVSQEEEDQKLASKVTLSIGLFPFSFLGRAVGRRRFRPIQPPLRRTRSTASVIELGDGYSEMTYGIGAFSVPPNLHFSKLRQPGEIGGGINNQHHM